MIGAIDFTISLLTQKLADEVYSHFKSTIGKAVTRSIDPMIYRLDRITVKIDDQLIIPYRAGLTFLKLGRFDDAVSELVRAEAANPIAAAPVFWLGFALAQLGRKEDGIKYIERAMTLNPLISEAIAGLQVSLPAPPSDAPPKRSQKWQRDISTYAEMISFPEMWTMFPRVIGTGAAAINTLAISGSRIFVSWRYGGALERDCQMVLSAFNTSGRYLWSILNKSELIFATRLHLLLKNDENGTYEIRDTLSGALVRTESVAYFEELYFPKISTVRFSGWINRSVSTEEALQKSRKDRRRRNLFNRATSALDPFDHDSSPFLEKIFAEDPLADGSLQVCATNEWSHAHIIVPFYGIPAGPPVSACGLWGKAQLQAFEQFGRRSDFVCSESTDFKSQRRHP